MNKALKFVLAISVLCSIEVVVEAVVISPIPGTNAVMNSGAISVPFSFGDLKGAADTVSVWANSSNPGLVPNNPSHLLLGGSGSNRFVQITPALGHAGVAPITVNVNHGLSKANCSFALMITPSPSVILYDPFDYVTGSLVTNSAFLWQTRSGTIGQCQVADGKLQVTASQTEDVVVPLIGAPYVRNRGTILYASFKIRFLSLPKIKPGYFAHFGGGNYLRARVFAFASTSLPGCYRLAIANGSTTNTAFPANLSTNTNYTVVTRYNVDAARTTLWVNPASESDLSVTATDLQSPVSIGEYGFRQDADVGATILVDDLIVGLSFAAVTSADPTHLPLLAIERVQARVVLRWNGSGFILQSAVDPGGPFIDLRNATSPWTLEPTVPVRIFRLCLPENSRP